MGTSRARDKAAGGCRPDHGGAALSSVGWWGTRRSAQTTGPGNVGHTGGASTRCSGSIVERTGGAGSGVGRTARTARRAVRISERARRRANVGFARAGIDTGAGGSGLGLTSAAVATRAPRPFMGRTRAFRSGALMGRTARSLNA